MARVIVIALVNMFLGLLIGKALSIYPEQVWLVIGIAVLLSLVLTTIIWLLMRPAKKGPKKATDELKEGEIHWLLASTSSIEGNIALVRSKKTKELKLLVFKEIPPTIFKKEKGTIVDATSQ